MCLSFAEGSVATTWLGSTRLEPTICNIFYTINVSLSPDQVLSTKDLTRLKEDLARARARSSPSLWQHYLRALLHQIGTSDQDLGGA
jgi:hypothetical protein